MFAIRDNQAERRPERRPETERGAAESIGEGCNASARKYIWTEAGGPSSSTGTKPVATGGSKNEGDCYERHREATADRCAVCDGPILGRYYDVKERGHAVKVHAEGSCYANFRS